MGEKRTNLKGDFSNAHHCIFCLSFCLPYPLPKSSLLCCCLYHKETSTAKYVYDKNYQLPPQTLGVSQFLLPLSKYYFFFRKKQVADKVADKRTDGWASLDWREHVAYSRAGVARYCAML